MSLGHGPVVPAHSASGDGPISNALRPADWRRLDADRRLSLIDRMLGAGRASATDFSLAL